MLDVHTFAALPEDETPARRANPAFTRLVHAYTNRARLPMLSREYERELIGLVQDADCQDSMNHLVQAHIGFITNIAGKFAKTSGMEDRLDDLYNEGCEAFVKSVKKFRLKRDNARLSTYARYGVAGACLTFVRENKHAFRVGTNLPDKAAFFGLGRIRKEFFEIHGRNLRETPEDIQLAADISGIRAPAIQRAMEIQRSGPAISPEDIQIHDMRTQDRPEAQLSRKSSREFLRSRINSVADTLTDRDRDILLTLIENPDERLEFSTICAERHNISVERIRQIYRGALAQIRAALEKDGFSSIADFG